MIGLTMYGTVAIFAQRVRFAPDRSIRSVWSRESLIVIANCGLLLLTAVTIVGTLMVPLSDLLLGHKIVVGLAFFNNVLIPIGLMLLCTNGAVPLLRWGVAPSIIQRRLLLGSVVVGCLTGLAAGLGGERNVLTLTVLSCAGFSVAVLGSALWLDTRRRQSVWLAAFVGTLRARRQQYAGYVMHLGFTCLAVGIAGSSLGSIRENVTMREGETISWSGYTVHLAKTRELTVADTLIGDVQLEFSRNGQNICTLFPAQHFHRQQNEWTTEVAIHSTWSRRPLHDSAGRRGTAQSRSDVRLEPARAMDLVGKLVVRGRRRGAVVARFTQRKFPAGVTRGAAESPWRWSRHARSG